jgi:hypothetical protein
MAGLIAILALGLSATPPALQAPAAVDWDLAVATFAANRGDGSKPPMGKGGARCAAYWTTHAGALTRKALPPEAIAKFDPELTSSDEAGMNAMVFSQLTRSERDYVKGKEEAAAVLAKLLTGDRASLVSYFKQLGVCSMGAG